MSRGRAWCLNCQKAIGATAKICKFCGHDQSVIPQKIRPEPPKAPEVKSEKRRPSGGVKKKTPSPAVVARIDEFGRVGKDGGFVVIGGHPALGRASRYASGPPTVKGAKEWLRLVLCRYMSYGLWPDGRIVAALAVFLGASGGALAALDRAMKEIIKNGKTEKVAASCREASER